jgi:tRNA U34 2-thiouridine synthase MnmA/TrmU
MFNVIKSMFINLSLLFRNMGKIIRALVMFSGGLDSVLAAKILQNQNIEAIGINFYSPFFAGKNAESSAKQLGIKLIALPVGKSYIKMLKKPRYGYGSAINPCIDCKIFMLKKAKSLMKKYKAGFIATGEVLGERPMSQHSKALDIIEKESGLKGRLLRPLSAKLLAETIPEKKGWIDRSRLLDISGRSRKIQMELAARYNLSYPTPGGGCLLCEKEFAAKLKDLFRQKEISMKEIGLLKIGRHFRMKDKIIVGRNQAENEVLQSIAKEVNASVLECKDVVGPITLVFGKDKDALKKAAELTALYSDALKQKMNKVSVMLGKKESLVDMSKINKDDLMKLRI